MIKAVSGTNLEHEKAFQEWKIRAEKAQGIYAIKEKFKHVFLTLKVAKQVGRAKDRSTFDISVIKYAHFLNDFHKLQNLSNLPDVDRQKIYSESINIVKDTFFENEPEFKKWNEKNKTSITTG